jgi:two-component system response regulator LytT
MRIVIVEDEPLIQQRIKRLTLEILSAHQPHIVCFGDIDDAHDYLHEETIDVLLLDLNLRGRDGFELLKASVAAAYHMIVISAYAEKAFARLLAGSQKIITGVVI